MKILVVDNCPLIRVGLSTILAVEDNVEEIMESSNISETNKILAQQKPDIAIVDLQLGIENGLDIVEKAKEKGCKTKIIIFTSSMRSKDILRAQRSDVRGYILKTAFPEDILYVLHIVNRGEKFFDTQIFKNNNSDINIKKLTVREKEVLMELGKGGSNSEISKALFISENTVKKHISNILYKLGLKHRTEAALLINNLERR
ncbi:LuxR C-terminal-related transcriptional regulator [Clostridium sp. DL1XJH146]